MTETMNEEQLMQDVAAIPDLAVVVYPSYDAKRMRADGKKLRHGASWDLLEGIYESKAEMVLQAFTDAYREDGTKGRTRYHDRTLIECGYSCQILFSPIPELRHLFFLMDQIEDMQYFAVNAENWDMEKIRKSVEELSADYYEGLFDESLEGLSIEIPEARTDEKTEPNADEI